MVNRMNRENVILTIKNMEDVKKLNEDNVKYINLDIKNINADVINYLKNNGQNYLYSDLIDNKSGYIYVDYNTFFHAEERINNIISKIPVDLNQIEKAKYLYISLGKLLSYDINVIPEKNDGFSFANINTICFIQWCINGICSLLTLSWEYRFQSTFPTIQSFF